MFSIATDYTRMNNHVNTRMNENLSSFNTCAYSLEMDIASRLDSAMKKAGYKTQAALANASGVPQPTIARILKGGGKYGPESSTIKKLALACGVSYLWLMEGAGEASFTTPVSVQPALAKPVMNLVYLDYDELELITHIRQATVAGKEILMNMAREIEKDQKKLKKLTKSAH